MGVQTFFNGLMRLAAALVSSLLLAAASRQAVLIIGGAGVLLTAAHAMYFARRESSLPAEAPGRESNAVTSDTEVPVQR